MVMDYVRDLVMSCTVKAARIPAAFSSSLTLLLGILWVFFFFVGVQLTPANLRQRITLFVRPMSQTSAKREEGVKKKKKNPH